MGDILKRAGMVDCKALSTLASVKTSDEPDVPYAGPTQYHSLVRALQYLIMTQPDFSFVVNKLCQHMQNPTTAH